MAAIDFPASPANGATFTPATGVTYRYVTPPGIWTVANGPVDTVIASDLPPANPAPNQLWFNASLAMLYVYYDDGNSQAWVPSMPVPAPGGPPPGFIGDFAGAAAPPGWLLCNGASYTVAAYPALHAAILYAFGGSGANFNVPDLRGRVTAGPDSGGSDRLNTVVTASGTPGSVGGVQSQNLTTAELPSGVLTSTATGPGYGLTFSGASIMYFASQSVAIARVQPTMIMNKIIRAV